MNDSSRSDAEVLQRRTLAGLFIGMLLGTCLVSVFVKFRDAALNPNPPPAPPRFTPRYKVVDLQMLGWSAAALNEKSEVVAPVRPEAATEKDGNTLSHVGLWSGGRIRGLRPLITAQVSNYSLSVNDSDEVTSARQLQSIGHAILYRKGVIIELGKLGGRGSAARKINNKGQIVGTSDVGGRQQVLDGELNQHAFLWQNGVMTDLGALNGKNSEANDINEAGQIVGDSDGVPVLWTAGKLKTLRLERGKATAINNKGQIVGVLYPAKSSQAFLWKAGQIKTLGIPVGYKPEQIGSIYPTDINDSGQIVGKIVVYGPTDFWHRLKRAQSSGFLWQKGKTENLNSIILAASGWTIDDALAINNRGDILAAGHRKDGYMRDHALLLTPIANAKKEL